MAFSYSDSDRVILYCLPHSVGADIKHINAAYHQKRYHFVQSLWGMLIGLIPCLVGAGLYTFGYIYNYLYISTIRLLLYPRWPEETGTSSIGEVC